MGIQFLPRPHYALELKKRRLHPENASNVFRPHYAWSIWKRNRVINAGQFWISAWLKLGLRNVMIIATSSFSNSVAFKTFSVHTKIQSRLFKFLRFEERFFEKLRFRDSVVCTGPKRIPQYLLTRWTIYGEVNEPTRPADVDEPIPMFLEVKKK